ncbi:DNA-directed RNA polymerase V subunit 1 isoform X2 [Typha latifolia]|uniref:DNA-directed RNA polymerase V subunit 1 isoform X2 n=1 Tax=Typha latifolia TaxID=4733 RepID=UPI003C2B875E
MRRFASVSYLFMLPIPVYHPSHVSELKHILSLVCLKCLRMKKGKVKQSLGKDSISTTSCFYCRDLPPLSVKEVKTTDGALFLELRAPSRKKLRDGFWNFLDRFGCHYGDSSGRPLLPLEVLNILKEIPEETRRRLAAKGYFPQTGYIMQHLPVPPNCLYSPEISDGKTIMSYDISVTLLKRILNKIELIKRSRSGSPNFESHEVESNDLQSSIAQYMHLRGTTKGPQEITRRFAIGTTEANECSTKQWLDKIRTLFIRKGSGFSSRSVITGDAYIGINVIGLPSEIAKKITFEERVTEYNMDRLQKVVDDRLCVTYKDGSSTYAISVGSKGHTFLKVGQIINRVIMDGDIVFINRPPSTHKHSLQAFYVYIHDDHTVKINPQICAPLGADFDGDCVHIFYPQSLAAKAEVLELFSVENQLRSSHTGKLNLQIVHDSLLSLKIMSARTFLNKPTAQQLVMFVSPVLPPPAILKGHKSGSFWTVTQILESAFPTFLDCFGEKHLIRNSEIVKLDFDRDFMQESFTEILSSIFIIKGPKEALNFLNVLQPLLMEILFLEGFTVSLKDFDVPKDAIEEIQKNLQESSYILDKSSSFQNQSELRVENHLRSIKQPIVDFILKFSSVGYLIDAKSDSAIMKVVQQLGFLGLQLYSQGKFYSRGLVEDCLSSYVNKYTLGRGVYPSEAYGLIKNSFYHGLNPYEELVHSISCREVMVRSSRGLTEPGTLFKNLMAILRDVIICYDGTVRNICNNSILQFEYGEDETDDLLGLSPPGEPVGVLAATAISNPAYKAVLDSSQSNNSSWELMKEILLTKSSYKNDFNDRRITLYLNDCYCGKRFCKEKAAIAVQSFVKRVILQDCTTEFSIQYQKEIPIRGSSETTSGLVGHIHLDQMQLELLKKSTDEILQKCQEVILRHGKKKGQLSHLFRRITLTASECCSTQKPNSDILSHVPCLQFSHCDGNATPCFESFERAVHVLANTICPILLDTIIKGDSRIQEAKIVWVGPDSTSWVRNSCRTLKGELAVELVVEKGVAQRNGDAWRTTMDACLPVMHLIDIRRSSPYGVQQIRELLGISCAFDQTVQRLSRSIKTVAKGVLKDHLILVASSMACTGNVNGFNTGGFRALYRSLKVQVPFTEATLFTPMKCFERAAEKCHSDSLDCVVSSCSWGKRVAIGTGSHFQILWDKKQMANEKDTGKGLYDFLSLVRTSGQRKSNGACFEDFDDLEEENDFEECLSPEFDGGFGKPTFEDNIEDDYNIQKSIILGDEKVGSWEKLSVSGVETNNWGGWGNGEPTDSAKSGLISAKSREPTDSWNNKNWNKHSDTGMDTNNWGGWGNGEPIDSGKSCLLAEKSGEPADSGNFKTVNSRSGVLSSWSSTKVQRNTIESENSTKEIGQYKPCDKMDVQKESNSIDQPDTSENWKSDVKKNAWFSASQANTVIDTHSWNEVENDMVEHHDKSPVWNRNSGSPKTEPGDSQVLGSETWGNESSSRSHNVKLADGTCNSKDEKAWTEVIESPSQQMWDSNVTNSSYEMGSQWNANASSTSNNWNSKNSGIPDNERLSNTNPWNENRGSDLGNQAWKPDAWGSSNSANWRGHKNPPGRPQRKNDDRKGWNPNLSLTSTRRRLESLTTEEEKILVEVQPIMQNIKRILRDSSDGDKLSQEDVNFIRDNVFEYHPDKQAKVVEKIDYIMVDKHKVFQETRCFYVVSSDGSSADFSYKKCMENFVKQNFPEHGESFNRKYFRKPNPAPNNGDWGKPNPAPGNGDGGQ